jgi:hypothetical protein
MNQASTGGKDRWQLISNILLANYRYSGDENNWNKFRFLLFHLLYSLSSEIGLEKQNLNSLFLRMSHQ